MATQVQLRRGTATENDAFTGAQGELSYDTTNKRLRIHDGATAGGFEIKTENAGGDVLFANGEKAIFGTGGASSQLQIYSDGSNSYIDDAGAGTLYIRGSRVIFDKYTGETMVDMVPDGAVNLFYNNVNVFQTAASGVNVVGTVTADGLTVDGSLGDFQVNTGGNQLSMTYNGNNYINTTGDGAVLNFRMTSAYTQAMKINANNDISFYEDTGTTPKFFWDASAESLGIGTSSPFFTTAGRTSLSVNGASSSILAFGKGGSSENYILADSGGLTIANTSATLPTTFFNNASNSMVIDSSGNVLVGTTDSAPGAGDTNTGVSFRAGGDAFFSKASSYAARFNRNTNDGDVVTFAKGGTTVGSISTRGGDTVIASTSQGVRFYDANNTLLPTDEVGAGLDDTISLGQLDGRWKDLFLSGGVVFGDAGGSGTSTSNSLDSYEEGTWTPTLTTDGTDFTSVTYDAGVSGTYTKVGRVVTVDGFMRTDAITKGSASGSVQIGGLPFASSPPSVGNVGGTIGWLVNSPTNCQTSGAKLYLTYGANSVDFIAVTDVATAVNDNEVRFSITYQTT
jgi:hypothetical protein